MPVPFLNLKRQYNEIKAEVATALTRVVSGGVYILGGEVEAFEDEWANFCQAQSAAAVANGTDALALALVASGAVRRGQRDEIVTYALSSAYTALAILNAGGGAAHPPCAPGRDTGGRAPPTSRLIPELLSGPSGFYRRWLSSWISTWKSTRFFLIIFLV